MRKFIAMMFATCLAGAGSLAEADGSERTSDRPSENNSTQRIVNPEHTPTNTKTEATDNGHKNRDGQDTRNGTDAKSHTPNAGTTRTR